MALFTVSGAILSCQYGSGTCRLLISSSRRITAENDSRFMGNETDFLNGYSECFRICHSPYRSSLDILIMRENTTLSNLQQAAAVRVRTEGDGLEPCNYRALFPWQNSNAHVQIAKARALMEDGWTICGYGLGIVSIVDPGQKGVSAVQNMKEKLAQLEKTVDHYMKENGIKEKHRDSLLESILLWNGYENIPWKYKSSEQSRAFCSYLEKEDPVLFNYFERGLYLGEGGNVIDVTYMMGMYKAYEKENPWDCVSMETVKDRGLYNGYLEACRLETGQGMAEMLASFLESYEKPDYDPRERYQYYASAPDQLARDTYCAGHSVDPSEMSVMEQNFGVHLSAIGGRVDEETAEAFVTQLRKDTGM